MEIRDAGQDGVVVEGLVDLLLGDLRIMLRVGWQGDRGVARRSELEEI